MAFTMDPGRLRDRVKLQAPSGRTSDGGGGYTTRFRNVVGGDDWAAIEPLSTTEQLRAMQAQANVTHRLTVKYRTGVTAAMRWLAGERVLKIVGPPTDPGSPQARSWLTMLVREET